MEVIEPLRQDVVHPALTKKYSSSIRFWHWLNAIVITSLLLTVLLNSTLLKTKKNALFIKDQLLKAGVTVTDKQARSVAHELSDKVWAIHTYFGYGLAGLLVFRLILEFFQLADQKFIRKIRNAYRQYFVIKKQRELVRHEFWINTLYAMFYIMLVVMVITGLCLAFKDDVPVLKSIHSFKQIHSFTMYLVLGFIVLHIIGVFLAERKDDKGIVSGMINGGRA